jgi:hypothetical protein
MSQGRSHPEPKISYGNIMMYDGFNSMQILSDITLYFRRIFLVQGGFAPGSYQEYAL